MLVTFKENVATFLRNKDYSGPDAIAWAMKLGHSTRTGSPRVGHSLNVACRLCGYGLSDQYKQNRNGLKKDNCNSVVKPRGTTLYKKDTGGV